MKRSEIVRCLKNPSDQRRANEIYGFVDQIRLATWAPRVMGTVAGIIFSILLPHHGKWAWKLTLLGVSLIIGWAVARYLQAAWFDNARAGLVGKFRDLLEGPDYAYARVLWTLVNEDDALFRFLEKFLPEYAEVHD